MRSFLKYWLFPVSCLGFAYVLSFFAFYSFTFGARLFHSVPAARACSSAGQVVLLPVRFLFFCYGGILDQSTPYSDPVNYMTLNAVILALIIYACLRPLVFREKKP